MEEQQVKDPVYSSNAYVPISHKANYMCVCVCVYTYKIN